jgi:lipooligosaccharide transport system ATP-binding protein
MDSIEPVIFIRNVVKSYGDLRAVNHVSFEVPPALCYGLLGPNGAGKSTMMKMIYGKALRDREGGEIRIFGFDPAADELAIKHLSGVVPQDDNLDEELDVVGNLMIYARFYGLPKKIAKERIDRLLGFMDLNEKRKVAIRELSGGMKRRLVIVRALLNNPRLLILDEPTTGLDPQVRHLIWDRLRKLKRDGVTILLTTHYMEEAFQICDRVSIMHKGEKVLEGAPQDLIEKNIEAYVLEVMDPSKLEKVCGLCEDPAIRQDRTGDMALLYSDDIAKLKAVQEGMEPGGCYLRQSNLEDLFLKTTGRSLNED